MAGRGARAGQQVSPAVVGVVGAIAALGLLVGVYFVVIKPGRDAAAAQQNWTSPEAAAARAPGARARPANHEEFLNQLRAKERGGTATTQPAGRSRRRDE